MRNVWAAKDIRVKILFTMFILVLYRLGTAIPVPYVKNEVLASLFSGSGIYSGTIFQYLNQLNGGALAQATLFALGISPYITASIVMQLLAVAFPKLERMSKDENGKKKISQITRYVTVALGALTAWGYFSILKAQQVLYRDDAFAALVIIFCFGAGAAIVMWLGEKINEKGIGNGISMILFANILSGFPTLINSLVEMAKDWPWATLTAVITALVGLAIIYLIVFVTNSERRIPIQYGKRVVGRKVYGGQNTNLPLKLNMSGVMPIIFASSIASLPATILTFFGITKDTDSFWGKFLKVFDSSSFLYLAIYLVLIVAFAYFYIMISFDPVEVSNNLKKNGGMIPGVRPGEPTAAYIKKILNRITFIGAVFLCIVVGVPMIANSVLYMFYDYDTTQSLASLVNRLYLQYNFAQFSSLGSSIIIVIGVILETGRDIESQLTMRHYKGFLQ
ncbi:MAG: preprotein translocase subunit SecY [Ruminococcaceae bacterium]|nr:preprotein translocase subunit SecY [Oscillospiraceae bacterium]